jgi:putative endonuclease
MSYYVYILHAEKFDRFYIGQTNNIEGRLERHNAGTETATKHYIPWQLVLFFEKQTRAEAMKLEKKLKNLSKERLIIFIQKHKNPK